MKKIFLMTTLLLSSLPAWADIQLEPLLNKVSLQLQAEQWVTTQTALVNVVVNATVTDQGIESIQTDVMQKLNQVSNKGQWHVISFDRQLDKSGLESVQMLMQARLPQTELANLRSKAKGISKPGVTYTIDSVQFVPSADELKQANSNLRNNIYQQAKNEIDAINKLYPDQKYTLHTIDFNPIYAMEVPQNRMLAKVEAASAAAPLSVGSKVQLQANVVVSAMPAVVSDKLSK